MKPLSLRAVLPADEPFLRQLYASTRDDLHMLVALDPVAVDTLIELQRLAQGTGYRALYPAASYQIVEQGGLPLGRLVVDDGAQALRLVDIALLPGARGQGLGTALLRGLQQQAAARRVPLALSVAHANPRARQLYLASGFVIVAEDDVRAEMAWCPTGPA